MWAVQSLLFSTWGFQTMAEPSRGLRDPDNFASWRSTTKMSCPPGAATAVPRMKGFEKTDETRCLSLSLCWCRAGPWRASAALAIYKMISEAIIGIAGSHVAQALTA